MTMPSCLVFQCNIAFGKNKGDRSFHKVSDPKKERTRAPQWIHNMGNARLNVNTFPAEIESSAVIIFTLTVLKKN